jgi:hypothetical protein
MADARTIGGGHTDVNHPHLERRSELEAAQGIRLRFHPHQSGPVVMLVPGSLDGKVLLFILVKSTEGGAVVGKLAW